jgi:hypothetical protein
MLEMSVEMLSRGRKDDAIYNASIDGVKTVCNQGEPKRGIFGEGDIPRAPNKRLLAN